MDEHTFILLFKAMMTNMLSSQIQFGDIKENEKIQEGYKTHN